MTHPSLRTELDGIEALVLDVDDTIIDTRAAMVAAGTAAMAALWPDAADHDAMALRYYLDPQRWFRAYAAGEIGFGPMRLARLRDVASAHGRDDPDDAALTRFEQAYAPAFAAHQSLLPGALELVAAARRRGLAVGLLTNSAAAPTTVKLDALDLHGRFDAVVTRDSLGFGKPDPRVYLYACDLLEAQPERTVCVGDSLEWDVLGAQDAGLRAVWFDRGDGVHNVGLAVPEHVMRITALAQLSDALGRFGPDVGER